MGPKTLIITIVCIVVFLLVRYILRERIKTNKLKKFWKDIGEHDKKYRDDEWDM